ncbi:hypothetical protein HAT2_00678 [Candidatus Similichlamydia laticola]|uniref:Uncharacterized protein n=1 Tax=Candidatus Similichlamydia laticola TaxID=2170265 RepID=A0A369KBA5_9BACT|nr:hypothetical protein HAT2_00678 [Candidatus Similichlamydia laticola]
MISHLYLVIPPFPQDTAQTEQTKRFTVITDFAIAKTAIQYR